MQDAVHRPEQGGPGLVVEHNDDAGGRQGRTAGELPFYAPDFLKSNMSTWN